MLPFLISYFYLFILVVLSFIIFRLYQIQSRQEIDYLSLLSQNAYPIALFTIIFLLYLFFEPWREPILIMLFYAFGIATWFGAIQSVKSYRKITSASIRIPQETYSAILFGVPALFSLLPDIGTASTADQYFQSAKVFLFLSIAGTNFMKLFLPTLFLSTGILNYPYPKTPWETVSKISWSTTSRNKVIIPDCGS